MSVVEQAALLITGKKWYQLPPEEAYWPDGGSPKSYQDEEYIYAARETEVRHEIMHWLQASEEEREMPNLGLLDTLEEFREVQRIKRHDAAARAIASFHEEAEIRTLVAEAHFFGIQLGVLDTQAKWDRQRRRWPWMGESFEELALDVLDQLTDVELAVLAMLKAHFDSKGRQEVLS